MRQRQRNGNRYSGEKKLMTEKVASNTVASRPPDWPPTVLQLLIPKLRSHRGMFSELQEIPLVILTNITKMTMD